MGMFTQSWTSDSTLVVEEEGLRIETCEFSGDQRVVASDGSWCWIEDAEGVNELIAKEGERRRAL